MMIARLFRAWGSLKTLPLVVAPSIHRPCLAVLASSRTFSSDEKGGNRRKPFGPSSLDDPLSTRWSFSQEGTSDDGKLDVFGEIEGDVGEVKLSDLGGEEVSQPPPRVPGATLPESEAWDAAEMTGDSPSRGEDIFEEASKGTRPDPGEDAWETAEGFKPWTLGEEDDEHSLGSEFGATPKGMEGISIDEEAALVEREMTEEEKMIQKEESRLTATLKGPDRAFGDLVAASGITEDMLDSLIALKDFEGIEGLPPLRELEDLRLEKSEKKSTRAKMEQQKQEEMDKLRVRKVDEKGRAYGTGRRKCSVARVWIQPGNGNFTVNDKEFDVYFPILDHRADLLKPFAETKTLGMWDVKCTVKGGGVSGQAGAVRLGISRALQNWEPGLRPYLRSEGLLTRDPRVVERKKPGKAKARKSFQWVKR